MVPLWHSVIGSCLIPDDCIESKCYPLFMAGSVLQDFMESLQSTSGVISFDYRWIACYALNAGMAILDDHVPVMC